ncbi:MAG: CehA/McbA family metallohydrolase [Planctomycetes bacterium]|nr:CehA/McbA family metallohydrolase [Planctomycetota bacterium]
MRSVFLAPACVLVLGVCAYLGSKPDAEPVKVRLKLVDAATGKDVGGMVRVFMEGKDEPLVLPGLFDRLRGVTRTQDTRGWYIVPAQGAEITLPRVRLRFEVVCGLESTLARQEVDLREKGPAEVVVKVPFLFRPEKEGLAAGNTHLHLRDLSPKDTDEYLRQIPSADGLKVMFLSYLERKSDDKAYVSNRYPVGELKQFRGTGVLFNNGEEHRHNFEAYGQGYGHVMFLDIKELVRPVSLGPGITGGGDDDRPLQPGLEEARRQGGTVLWCHNTSGYESLPSVLAGRFDALNVFDGSRTGRYEDSYYRYLNIGLRLPISTGTDWFLYDFARVYARVEGRLTVKSWLQSLRAGRSVATNGPLLRLTVDGRPVGEVLKFDAPKTIHIEAEGIGRHAFERLQLVHNGKVVQEVRSRKKDGGFSARLVRDVRVTEPGWFAVRIDGQVRNELGHVLFAHSSPCYVDFQGQRPFDLETGRALLRRLEEARADITAKGRFSTPPARAKLLAVYDKATDDLRARINRRGR